MDLFIKILTGQINTQSSGIEYALLKANLILESYGGCMDVSAEEDGCTMILWVTPEEEGKRA